MEAYNQMGSYTILQYNKDEFTSFIVKYLAEAKLIKKKRHEYYLDTLVSFDTETSSVLIPQARAVKNDEELLQYIIERRKENPHYPMPEDYPFAFVYIWQLAFGGNVWYGRTMEEFVECMGIINIVLEAMNRVNKEVYKLVVYVHNLAFEWQFIKHYFNWNVKECLAVKPTTPLYVTTGRIEFRCSLLLTGLKLADITAPHYKKLTKDEMKKKFGEDFNKEFDYSIVRTSKTELKDYELLYAIYDCLVVLDYLQEFMQIRNYDMATIPLTKTGIPRAEMKKLAKDNARFRDFIQSLTIDIEEYDMISEAFVGGFTHANSKYVDLIIKDVDAYDISSSYPTVLCTYPFPISKGIYYECGNDITINDIMKNDYIYGGDKLHFVKVYVDKVKALTSWEFYWSSSKGSNSGCVEFNGRVMAADSMIVTLSSPTYKMFVEAYGYKNIIPISVVEYEAGYLPREIIETILEYYKQKTLLKDDKDKIALYNVYKSMLNAIYGMFAQQLLKDNYVLDDELEFTRGILSKEEKIEALDNANNKFDRFSSYSWAPFVTGWAQYRLWEGIGLVGENYIYTDTDSIKCIHTPSTRLIFDKLDAENLERIKQSAEVNNIPIEDFMPNGKVLGAWDFEGNFNFKTCGPKKYFMYDNNERIYDVRCAGLNRELFLKYLTLSKEEDGFHYNKKGKKVIEYKYEDDILNLFTGDMVIENDDCCKRRVRSKWNGSVKHAIVKGDDGTVQDVYSASWLYIGPGRFTMDRTANTWAILDDLDFFDEFMNFEY